MFVNVPVQIKAIPVLYPAAVVRGGHCCVALFRVQVMGRLILQPW